MKLIDKDALVAWALEELKLAEKFYKETKSDVYFGKINLLKKQLSFLDTLEVKEVDLEDTKKEEFAQKYMDYIFKRHNIDPESKEGQLIYYAYMHGMNQCLNQLKAQKGE